MLVGLIADTHVPYRVPEISPDAVSALRGVDVILHAGDVDEPWALAPLEALAPVYAVRGNYHILDRSAAGADLPETVTLDLDGFCVIVNHGYDVVGRPASLLWKARSVLRNLVGRWDFPAYDRAIARSLVRHFPRADVIVFGHTHRYYEAVWGATLIVNPGAASRTSYFGAPFPPSVAHLTLRSG
ncbi:MAG: metallophosphoesterase family protein, partial [Anaerolineae bacterium]|nr:metallophosphoesterase family protein [Anaerolineae bacterium]